MQLQHGAAASPAAGQCCCRLRLPLIVAAGPLRLDTQLLSSLSVLQMDLVQMGQKVDDEKDRLLERVSLSVCRSGLVAQHGCAKHTPHMLVPPLLPSPLCWRSSFGHCSFTALCSPAPICTVCGVCKGGV